MVDFLTITLALVTLIVVVRRIRAFRPMPGIVLTLLAAAWTWANLRDAGWEDMVGGGTPEKLDPVTKAAFWRDWPLEPFMLCLIYFSRYQPRCLEGLASVSD
ncbi:hypothetical protein OJF2_65570 [Aquisphaera giovannonii]|uniref:Uncharacterized protein n=1 Tax=Aquisphaera giovannonii TaxID=406548 RepID=A0A5B9WDD6_9BACT|nr:hypothetical protein [Aquisphaera giovannonii]QEH37961.1 hypothetical protein OJF2_65570 [Aquisphaera giovannonii]